MATAIEVRDYKLLIDGQMVDAASGETFETVSPATNEVVGRVAKAGPEDVDRAVAAARKAFDDGRWSRMAPNERAKRMRRAADILRERVDELAELETLNCGKIIVESRGDVLNSANCLEYYANLTGQIWGETIPMNGPLFDYTVREPVGVCAQIIPWNFPLLMAAWKLGPALAAGNTIVLKPASNTPITAVVLGQICQEAGIPDGVVNVLPGPGRVIGAALCEHPDVDKVAFTGETETGRDILRLSAGTIKKVSLELGGKSPNIVFPDADIDEAVRGSLFAIFTNAGQRCTARTRLFLHESIHDKFMSEFVAKTAQIRVGDPMEWDTQMGPVISTAQCERVLSFVEKARGEGADLAHGGRKVDTETLSVVRIQRVLGVDECGDTALGLDVGDGVQRNRGLATGLRAVDLDDAAARQAADAESDVEGDRAGGNDVDRSAPLLTKAHDRALAELALDLGEGGLQRLLAVSARGGRWGLLGGHGHSFVRRRGSGDAWSVVVPTVGRGSDSDS